MNRESMLPTPLVLDAHQLRLITSWQTGVETGEGPALYVSALRGERAVGTTAVPFEGKGAERLAPTLRAIGRGYASAGADALLAVWHDAQLHAALGVDCPWPGRLCALRVESRNVSCDYYPAAIDAAGPLATVTWSVEGSIRDPQPMLPVTMLELVGGFRDRRPWLWGRCRLRSTLRAVGVDLSAPTAESVLAR